MDGSGYEKNAAKDWENFDNDWWQTYFRKTCHSCLQPHIINVVLKFAGIKLSVKF